MQKENINFGVCEDEKGKHFTWKMGLKGSCKMLFVSRERKRVGKFQSKDNLFEISL